MIIHCEKCKSEFQTDDTTALSPESGIRCPKCGYVSISEQTEGRRGSNAEEIPDWDLGKVTGDGGNWEEFVNISKTEEEPEDFRLGGPPDPEKQECDFNWENLSIDHEPDYVPDRAPAMFEDEEQGEGEAGTEAREHEYTETTSTADETTRRSTKSGEPDILKVDMDVLTNNPYRRQNTTSGSSRAQYESLGVHPSRSKQGGGLLSKLAFTIVTIAVLTVIIAASFIILLNLNIIPKDSASKIRALIESVVPVNLGVSSKNEVVITGHSGKWMDTRNGSLYIVSGMVTNKSQAPVNYIKIKSDFMAGGQVLYQSDIYAGNTFTDNELKVSPLQDILLKLQKKNGNIDYYDTDKLAGLNYNIRPGESIPFYTIFPSTSRVLGLKYRLQVVAYEDTSVD